jgi:hypothetical protein
MKRSAEIVQPLAVSRCAAHRGAAGFRHRRRPATRPSTADRRWPTRWDYGRGGPARKTAPSRHAPGGPGQPQTGPEQCLQSVTDRRPAAVPRTAGASRAARVPAGASPRCRRGSAGVRCRRSRSSTGANDPVGRGRGDGPAELAGAAGAVRQQHAGGVQEPVPVRLRAGGRGAVPHRRADRPRCGSSGRRSRSRSRSSSTRRGRSRSTRRSSTSRRSRPSRTGPTRCRTSTAAGVGRQRPAAAAGHRHVPVADAGRVGDRAVVAGARAAADPGARPAGHAGPGPGLQRDPNAPPANPPPEPSAPPAAPEQPGALNK